MNRGHYLLALNCALTTVAGGVLYTLAGFSSHAGISQSVCGVYISAWALAFAIVLRKMYGHRSKLDLLAYRLDRIGRAQDDYAAVLRAREEQINFWGIIHAELARQSGAPTLRDLFE